MQQTVEMTLEDTVLSLITLTEGRAARVCVSSPRCLQSSLRLHQVLQIRRRLASQAQKKQCPVPSLDLLYT